MLHSFKEASLQTITFVCCRSKHKFVHQFWMTDSNLKRSRTAIAKTHDVRFFNAELLKKLCNIIGIMFKAQRTIDIGSMSMSLQFNSNNLMSLCKLWQDATKRRLNCRATAMQQHQWPTSTMNLI